MKRVMANSGQEAVRNSFPQLDLPIVKSSSSVVEDLHKARRKLCGYKESRRDSEFAKARAEAVLSEAKKLVEELTLLIERSNRGAEFQKDDMEASKIQESGKYAEVIRVLEAVKEEHSKVKFDIASMLRERSEVLIPDPEPRTDPKQKPKNQGPITPRERKSSDVRKLGEAIISEDGLGHREELGELKQKREGPAHEEFKHDCYNNKDKNQN